MELNGRNMIQNRKEILSGLGVYGLSDIEDAILAGLITRDPLLLIGSHGSAKTLLATRIAHALNLSYHAYDASKCLFEDVLGFPSPLSLSKGVVEYIPTPISIWGKQFVLLDEISRASPSMQNKWLEVIRSRQIMGKKLEGLDYIMAAMNPVGYLGTLPLDAALAGRFAFIIKVPEAKDMNTADIFSIIEHVSDDDAPGLALKNQRKQYDSGSLKELLDSARDMEDTIVNRYDGLIRSYVVNISTTFRLQQKPLDGRRLGMLRRNIIAYLLVRSVKKGGRSDFSVQEIDTFLFNCVKHSLPFEATGEGMPAAILYQAHNTAMGLIGKGNKKLEARLKVFLSKTPGKMIENYTRHWQMLSRADHADLVSYFEEQIKGNNDVMDLALYYVALKKLVRFYQSRPTVARPDEIRRAFTLYQELSGFCANDIRKLADILSDSEDDDDAEAKDYPILRINFSDPGDLIPFRLAFYHHARHGSERIKAIMRTSRALKSAFGRNLC